MATVAVFILIDYLGRRKAIGAFQRLDLAKEPDAILELPVQWRSANKRRLPWSMYAGRLVLTKDFLKLASEDGVEFKIPINKLEITFIASDWGIDVAEATEASSYEDVYNIKIYSSKLIATDLSRLDAFESLKKEVKKLNPSAWKDKATLNPRFERNYNKVILAVALLIALLMLIQN
jgi:hypothetical protein